MRHLWGSQSNARQDRSTVMVWLPLLWLISLWIAPPGMANGNLRPGILLAQAGRADDLRREIEAFKKQVDAASEKEASIIGALEKTEKALGQARQAVNQGYAELKAVERRIRELEKQYRAVAVRIERNEQYVADRLTALYKLGWLGKLNILGSADSVMDFITTQNALARILARDAAVIAQMAADKADMQVLMTTLLGRKKAQQETTAALSRRIDAMNTEQAKREVLLTRIRSRKALQLAAIESMQAAAEELDRKMAAFQDGPPPIVTSTPGAAEKHFAALKGLLMMPVDGKIVSFFGRQENNALNVTHFQSGITIKADRGEPIRAVYGGRTLFSSWFRGFGNMIIIDHGDHYYTVYAHLEEQFKAKGDIVETGEVIATVGDTGSLTGAGLHFEIRHHGKPMDPMHWIKKG